MEEEMSKIVNPDKIAKDTLDFYYDEAKEKVRFFERKLQHDIQHKAVHWEKQPFIDNNKDIPF